jgi:hypothetical protein
MDRIINYLLLVIIFVFDPLAIALVIAANFAFARLNKRDETPLEEKVEDMRHVVEAYDDLQDEIKEYKIYEQQDKTPTPELIPTNVEEDWVIEDEDNPKPDINEEFIKSLDKINQINDGNEDFFWKKARIDEEIDRIKAYEKSLKQKKLDEDENITIY